MQPATLSSGQSRHSQAQVFMFSFTIASINSISVISMIEPMSMLFLM